MTAVLIDSFYGSVVEDHFNALIKAIHYAINDRFKKSPSFRSDSYRMKRSEMEKSLNYIKRFLHYGRNDALDKSPSMQPDRITMLPPSCIEKLIIKPYYASIFKIFLLIEKAPLTYLETCFIGTRKD